MSTLRQNVLPIRSRRMPSVLHFAADARAHSALTQCARIQYACFESSDCTRLSGQNVFLLADEALFAQHLPSLRAANVRVIALSDQRFRNPRLDGSVYAYLPVNTPAALLERTFDNAIDHMRLALTQRETSDKLALANTEIHELNRIGAALSAEHDASKLLELILSKCREITRADAGSIYLIEEEEPGDESRPFRDHRRPKKSLRFKMAQNDSIPVSFRETVLPLSERSIAGYVAQHGSVVMVEDAYAMEDWVPYGFNKQFDIDSGYHTKSILAVAMMNPKGEVVGVVQLINPKRNWRARLNKQADVQSEVVPFTTRQMEIVSSLASQAAVAYENSLLYENIQRLFEGFVKASINTIEQRDPATSGHSFRVTNLTVALAEAVDRNQTIYRDVKFTRSEMKEIRYASLLHDFGKVLVREQVLTKARKLYPEHMEVIVSRFEIARHALQLECGERKLRCLTEEGREAYESKLAQFDSELDEQLKELDRFAEAVCDANKPSVLPVKTSEALNEIAAKTFRGRDGVSRPLLTPEEVRMLSIRKGSLDSDERAEVESHVVRSYKFLKQIPWTKEIRNIPEIARSHHEKMNGKGYPEGLVSNQIPLTSRMMAIADVFDALAAADRPYKSAVSVERALEILGGMARDGELDEQLFSLFVQEKVYERWKQDCVEY
jgi:HD-GYP domain-containing protein (c-di-GMP phosphodiesterase class II)